MCVIFSSSMSAPSLCSALAIADSSTLRMITAPFLGLNCRMLSACSTGMPRIRSATSRPFWADRRTPFSLAVVFISGFLISWPRRGAGAAGAAPAVGADFLSPPGAAAAAATRRAGLGVALEDAGVRKLAQLVADHVLGDVHRDVLLAVVHGDGQAHEIGQDGRAARPGLDRALVVGLLRRFDLLDQVRSTNGPFLIERAMD